MYNSSFTDLMWLTGKVLVWGMAVGFVVFLILFGRSMINALLMDELGNDRTFSEVWRSFRTRHPDALWSLSFFLILFSATYFFYWCC